MVTRDEIARKIDIYLKGKISDKELDAWALDHLVRGQEDDSIEGIVIGEAIGLLNMLHDENARFRASNSELENMRDLLLGKRSYQIKRLCRKDFTHYCAELFRKIEQTIAALSKPTPTNFLYDLIEECKGSNPGTIHGLLLRHLASLFEMASTAVRSGVVEPYVVADIADGTSHVSVADIIRELQNVYSCLKGQKAFTLTIVGKPDHVYQTNIVIS